MAGFDFDNDDSCITCGGYGLEDKLCPECGKDKKSLDLSNMEPKTLRKFIVTSSAVGIPDNFTGVEWTANTFWSSKPDSFRKDVNLVKYITKLEKLHGMFVEGLIPSSSTIIIAPSTYSKITFAYSCMSYAIKAGHRVAPLLDTIELKRLMVLAGENPSYRLNGNVDYDKYIMSAIVFVTVTKTEYSKDASFIMRELLDRRSRKGLPTFFLSEYDIPVLMANDKEKPFMRTPSGSFDKLKYPNKISYAEYFIKKEGDVS